jgi:hypothetical protein
MRDADQLEEDLNWYWESIVEGLEEALADEVLATRLRDLVDALATLLRPQFTKRMAANRPLPYLDTKQLDIRPKQDVAAAIAALRGRSDVPQGHRDSRDRLRDVQVAILKEDGWGWSEIAERYGWKVQAYEYGTPLRCESARIASREGEEILAASPNTLYRIHE